MSRPRFIALLLALITLVVYLPATRFAFVNFDDNEYITENPPVSQGLSLAGVKWAFTTFHAGNWHPLTWLSHMTDCQLFHLNAGGHHFVNALFHAVNVALLFTLLWRLTQAVWPAALVAGLFAWHPLHVESVAWIAERKDVLSTCFALLALLSYARYVRENSRRSYWLALGFFALGLMSKSMLVTLPCWLLLLDYWPLQRWLAGSWRQLVREKIPFFALTAGACSVTFVAQHAAHAVVPLALLSFKYRLEDAVVGVGGYVAELFWPADLCVIHPLPDKFSPDGIFAALAVLVLISVLAWRWRSSRPYFLTGWLWFLGTLAPVSGLVQVGGQTMADRYTYLPSIGFFVALVFLGTELAARLRMPVAIRFGIAILVCGACIVATERQMVFWRNSETLFRRAVALNPGNDVALIDLGVALGAQGRLTEAMDAYRQAEKTGGNRYQVHGDLGEVLGQLGRSGESLAEFQTAIRLAPDIATLRTAAGRQLAALNRFDEALQEFSAAAKLDPNSATPRLETAQVLLKLGRDADGLTAFHNALRLDPDNVQILAALAHYLAATDNAANRDGRGALLFALKANELSGHGDPRVFDVLGMALAENGEYTNAIVCAQNALQLAAGSPMNDTGAIQARLELYRSNEPWHESFRATNAPDSK